MARDSRISALWVDLGAGWRGLLRGSVALSRTIPSMTMSDAPVAPMAEDSDPEETKQDRAEAPPDAVMPDTMDE